MRRTRSTSTDLSSLGTVLQRSLDSSGLRQKIAEQQAVAKWREVVGPQIAAVTTVDKVRDGVLFVVCKNSMWASELSLHTQEILRKLSQALGRQVITEIRFSARGFRKTQERDESLREQVDIDAIELSTSEEAAAAQAASSARAEELAEKIKKAVLACKRRARAMREKRSSAA